MERVYLSLGSNIGDRVGFLKRAINLISGCKGISYIESSSFYETEPQGYIDQDEFINCVVSIDTSLSPEDLLEMCQGIEKKLKRKRLFRWGPRTIDVDILTYGNIIIDRDDLKIPHERMFERAFVLVPLCELNNSYGKYLRNIEDQKVRKINV